MMIAKNDEEKRSKIWGVITSVTTVLIIVIAAFFLFKLFMGNPLEGNWLHDESDTTLRIHGNGTLEVEFDELNEEADVKVKMDYVIDKDAKTITIKTNDAEITKAAESADEEITKDRLEMAVNSFATTFDYNMEQSTLTLTEREYGEQMIFHKE